MADESSGLLTVSVNQVISALQAAGSAFSGFIDRPVGVACPSVKVGQLTDTDYMGTDLESAVVAACLMISGDLEGIMVLVFPSHSSCCLVDMLMGNELGTTTFLDDMGRSAIAEIGNVVGSAFLNALADETSTTIMVSPPATTEDMAGAILGSLYAEALARGDYAVIAQATFTEGTGAIQGDILILPDPNSFRVA